jgi:hypothetical protein
LWFEQVSSFPLGFFTHSVWRLLAVGVIGSFQVVIYTRSLWGIGGLPRASTISWRSLKQKHVSIFGVWWSFVVTHISPTVISFRIKKWPLEYICLGYFYSSSFTWC